MKKKHIVSFLSFLFVLVVMYIPTQFGSTIFPVAKPNAIEAKTTKNALEGQFHLDDVVKIYIPSRDSNSNSLPEGQHAANVDQTLEIFSNMFGGATAIDGQGAWVNDDSKLVKEDVTIVYSFASKLNNKTIDEVVAYAKKVKTDLNQSSVSLEVNGKMYFIE